MKCRISDCDADVSGSVDNVAMELFLDRGKPTIYQILLHQHHKTKSETMSETLGHPHAPRNEIRN